MRATCAACEALVAGTRSAAVQIAATISDAMASVSVSVIVVMPARVALIAHAIGDSRMQRKDSDARSDCTINPISR